MRRLTPLVPLALALAGCARPPAEQPLVRIEARDFQLAMPARVPAGFVRVRLVNQGGFWHHALLVRLAPPLTAGAYLDSVRAGSSWPKGGLDVGGTPQVGPGDSLEVLVNLEPGRYAAVCFGSGGGVDHAHLGMVTGFEVVGSTSGDAPPDTSADLVLRMVDHAFDFPESLPAGRVRLRIQNDGRAFHEVDIVRLDPGKTVLDYRAWAERKQTPPAAGRMVGGTADFGPGGRTWETVLFEPGTHVLVCDIHADSGQVSTFEVTAAAR